MISTTMEVWRSCNGIGAIRVSLVLALMLGPAGVARSVAAPVAVPGSAPAEVNPRSGLPRLRAELEASRPVTLVYLGGSLTEFRTWTARVAPTLRRLYDDAASIREINAGVSGTGSGVGVLRVDREVLSHHPDLVVVEFAVNDVADPLRKSSRAMEGIVRKIRSMSPRTEILFVYLFAPRFSDALDRGELPDTIRAHEKVAAHYGIPSIEVASTVSRLARDGKLRLRGAKDADGDTVPAFAPDGIHPHAHGKRLYARAVAAGLEAILADSKPREASATLPLPLDEGHFGAGRKLPFSTLGPASGWRRLEADPDSTPGRLGIELWEASGVDASPVEFGFRGKILKFYEDRSLEPGGIEVRVDGEALPAESFRVLTPGPRLRVLHVRRKFDPAVEHRISLRVTPPVDAPSQSRPVRLGDLLVIGEVSP